MLMSIMPFWRYGYDIYSVIAIQKDKLKQPLLYIKFR